MIFTKNLNLIVLFLLNLHFFQNITLKLISQNQDFWVQKWYNPWISTVTDILGNFLLYPRSDTVLFGFLWFPNLCPLLFWLLLLSQPSKCHHDSGHNLHLLFITSCMLLQVALFKQVQFELLISKYLFLSSRHMSPVKNQMSQLKCWIGFSHIIWEKAMLNFLLKIIFYSPVELLMILAFKQF